MSTRPEGRRRDIPLRDPLPASDGLVSTLGYPSELARLALTEAEVILTSYVALRVLDARAGVTTPRVTMLRPYQDPCYRGS